MIFNENAYMIFKKEDLPFFLPTSTFLPLFFSEYLQN